MSGNINDKTAAQDWQSKKSHYPNLDGEWQQRVFAIMACCQLTLATLCHPLLRLIL